MDGQSGLFPSNFVEIIDDFGANKSDKEDGEFTFIYLYNCRCHSFVLIKTLALYFIDLADACVWISSFKSDSHNNRLSENMLSPPTDLTC